MEKETGSGEILQTTENKFQGKSKEENIASVKNLLCYEPCF